MQTLTPQKFTPTSTMIGCAEAVFMAMAYTQTVKPVVEEYQRNIITMIDPIDERGDPIKEGKDSWRMKDKDFDEYLYCCHEDAIKAGFKVKERGYCPLLVAEELERVAKRTFAGVMLTYLRPMVSDLTLEMLLRDLKTYNKFIELNLSLLAPYVCKGV